MSTTSSDAVTQPLPIPHHENAATEPHQYDLGRSTSADPGTTAVSLPCPVEQAGTQAPSDSQPFTTWDWLLSLASGTVLGCILAWVILLPLAG